MVFHETGIRVKTKMGQSQILNPVTTKPSHGEIIRSLQLLNLWTKSSVTIQMKHLCQNVFIVLFISRDFTKRNLNSFRGDRVEAMDPSFDFHIVLPNSQP